MKLTPDSCITLPLNPFREHFKLGLLLIFLCLGGICQCLQAAEGEEPGEETSPSIGDRVGVVTEEIKEQAGELGQEAQEASRSLMDKIEDGRLKNRTRDEIVTWIVVGAMVGGLAGILTTRRRQGYGVFLNLLVGLTGAFLGGMLVHVTEWDLGWGRVQIRYEEFFAALAGALLIVFAVKVFQARWNKNRAKN